MRGVGKRRQDDQSSFKVKRKPVPSTLYEKSPHASIGDATFSAEQSPKAMDRQQNVVTPEPSDPEYIRFALDQLSNDPDSRGERMPFAHSRASDLDLDFTEVEKDSPLRSHPVLTRGSVSPPIPIRSARRSATHSPDKSRSLQQSSLLLPFDRPSDSFHEPLTALPTILQPLRLSLFMVALSLYISCLLLCAIWSLTHASLSEYGTLGDARYFLWQYLPTILGMAILLWLFEIQTAVFRVAPFLSLSSHSPTTRSHGVFLPLSPSTFLLPTFAHYRAGLPAISIFMAFSWLSLLTIPLLASSFNVYSHEGRWMWLATQGVIWTVIALYLLLLAAVAILVLYLHGKQTGLKWDARSLADLITLVQASNTLSLFADHPFTSSEDEMRQQIAEQGDRLGYFRNSLSSSEVIHTIAASHQPMRDSSTAHARESDNTLSSQFIDLEKSRPYSDYSGFTKYTTDSVVLPRDMAASWQSCIPWFLTTPLVIIWQILAVACLLAFLIVSYIPSTRVSQGFPPKLSVLQDSNGFSATNFFYSFLPSLLGLLCLLIWQPFDMAYRRLQPYVSLSTPGGELAENSLLLSYTADAPIWVVVQAVVNRHFRIALINLTTLIAATLPVLGGGVFWSQFSVTQQRVLIYPDLSAYYALSVFFTLYCLSYFLLFPGQKRKLPNRGRCLADVIAFVHQSKILDEPEFHAPASKIALVTRLISPRPGNRADVHDTEKRVSERYAAVDADFTGSKISLADSLRGIAQARRSAHAEARFSGGSVKLVQPRYGFGRYIGRDGREWLGIDKIGRPGRGGEMIPRD